MGLSSVNILIIDDDEDVAYTTREMLSKAPNRSVKIAASAREASNMLGWADLAVLDGSVIGHSDIDKELLHAKIPFIVFSGSDTRFSGAVAVVSKPDVRALKSSVDVQVERIKSEALKMTTARELLALIESCSEDKDSDFKKKVASGTLATIRRVLGETIPMYIKQKNFTRAASSLKYTISELENLAKDFPEWKNTISEFIDKANELEKQIQDAQG
jgi:CheY-like chemotaxis protein